MTEVIKKKIEVGIDEELDEYLFLTNEETFLWTPLPFRKSSKPKSEWLTFRLKGKTGLQFIKDEDNLSYKSEKGALKTASGTSKLETLRTHIKDWKNAYDKKGNEIKFMSGNNGVSKKLLDKFPPKLMNEVYEAINRQSTMSEEELTGLEF